MVEPSGDQTGLSWVAAFEVTWTMPVPSMLATQTWLRVPSERMNATFLPFGAMAGLLAFVRMVWNPVSELGSKTPTSGVPAGTPPLSAWVW